MCEENRLEEYNRKIKRVLFTEEEIKAAVKKAGKQISDSYDGNPILLVSILKGSFVFATDLCREIMVPCEIGFMRAKSYYGGTSSAGKVTITLDLDQDISKYHVIIVEDIIDTGRTMRDISLFTIADYFVIGYGLDSEELYRNLPYIAEYNNE